MKVVLFTAPNCPRCPLAKEIVSKICKELNIEYQEIVVDSEDKIVDALMYNIYSFPALVIDDEVIFQGEVPSEDELRKIFLQKLGK